MRVTVAFSRQVGASCGGSVVDMMEPPRVLGRKSPISNAMGVPCSSMRLTVRPEGANYQ